MTWNESLCISNFLQANERLMYVLSLHYRHAVKPSSVQPCEVTSLVTESQRTLSCYTACRSQWDVDVKPSSVCHAASPMRHLDSMRQPDSTVKEQSVLHSRCSWLCTFCFQCINNHQNLSTGMCSQDKMGKIRWTSVLCYRRRSHRSTHSLLD